MPDFQEIDPATTYTQAEAAALTGRAPRTVLTAMRTGALPATREGSTYRIAGADLTAADARADVDPTPPERQLEDALCAAIADQRGYRGDWWVGDDGLWHVELLSPFRDTFGGTTLAQALGWTLVGVMGWTGELGHGPFA